MMVSLSVARLVRVHLLQPSVCRLNLCNVIQSFHTNMLKKINE